jgi:hypothetical protein
MLLNFMRLPRNSVSQVVIHEAERQRQAVFGDTGVPPNLISMHIRWGDEIAEGASTEVLDFVVAIETIEKGKES